MSYRQFRWPEQRKERASKGINGPRQQHERKQIMCDEYRGKTEERAHYD
jgi:hypothetical protein